MAYRKRRPLREKDEDGNLKRAYIELDPWTCEVTTYVGGEVQLDNENVRYYAICADVHFRKLAEVLDELEPQFKRVCAGFSYGPLSDSPNALPEVTLTPDAMAAEAEIQRVLSEVEGVTDRRGGMQPGGGKKKGPYKPMRGLMLPEDVWDMIDQERGDERITSFLERVIRDWFAGKGRKASSIDENE